MLIKIYNDPVYYSGYYIRTLPCNLRLTGDAAAEQNHSSIKSHHIDGKTWSLMKQAQSMMERQQLHHIQNLTLETNHYFEGFHTKQGEGFIGLQTTFAMQSLAKWPFDRIWKVNSKSSSYLQYEISIDNKKGSCLACE